LLVAYIDFVELLPQLVGGDVFSVSQIPRRGRWGATY